MMPKLINGLTKLLPNTKLAPLADPLKLILPLIQTEVSGDQLISKLELDSIEKTASRISSIADTLFSALTAQGYGNKFKQIGLAIHNFESSYGALPPAIQQRDKDGKSGLSWRVHILPFLGDEQRELWGKFRQDEPWDSAHNIQLLDEIPAVYDTNTFSLSNRDPVMKTGYTTFVAPAGEGTIFGGTEVVRFGNIQDGISNTIMVVQVKPELAVPWTAPQDYDFDPKDAFAGLAEQGDGTFAALFADGSWQDIPLNIAKDIAVYLFTMNDGQVMDW
jgi:hypothetical protein